MGAFTLFLIQSLNTLSIAAILFLITMGMTLIFGIMRILNFAHGAIYMLGAYIGTSIYQISGNFWVSIVVAPVLTMIFGVLAESLLLRRLYGRDGTAFLLVTFGLALMITEAIRFYWGPNNLQIDAPDALAGVAQIAGEPYSVYRLFLIAAGLASGIAIWIILQTTRFGLLIRSTAQNAAMTEALGVNVTLVRRAVFGASCGLAALGGVLSTPLFSASIGMGAAIIIDACVVIMIGGMGSLIGTAAGCLLLGLFQAFGTYYFPDYAIGASFMVMIVVLLIRPGGLFGMEE